MRRATRACCILRFARYDPWHSLQQQYLVVAKNACPAWRNVDAPHTGTAAAPGIIACTRVSYRRVAVEADRQWVGALVEASQGSGV